jgi:hypothetical protein
MRELPVEETARLCRDYRKLVESLPYGLTVNAEQPPQQVAAGVAEAIVDALNRRIPQYLPWTSLPRATSGGRWLEDRTIWG